MIGAPVPFRPEMALAVIENRKTETRRPSWTFRQCPECKGAGRSKEDSHCWGCRGSGALSRPTRWQKMKPGTVLWVRERAEVTAITTVSYDRFIKVKYIADSKESDWLHFPDRLKFTPQIGKCLSMGCHREASRLTLVVTATKLQRVQDITEAEAKAEGMAFADGDGGQRGSGYKWTGRGYHGAGFTNGGAPTFHIPGAGKCSCKIGGPSPAQCAFRELWESIHGPKSWDDNPDLVAVRFDVHKCNIDQMKAAA